MRSVSALKDLSELVVVVLLGVLFLLRPDLLVVPTSFRAPAFVTLELIDIPSVAFAISLLCFRPPWMLLAGCLSSVLGLVRRLLAFSLSFVLGAETLGAASRVSFSDFVVVTGRFFSILIVCFRRVRLPPVRLGGLLIATLGCFFTAAGGDFGLLIRVAICEVLGDLVRAGDFGACLALAKAGLEGLTDVAMRDVFAGLNLLGADGFGAFGARTEAGGLGLLRLGVMLLVDPDAFGGAERGAGRLGWGALALANERGWLLCCGRAEALGAEARGWVLR
jgi:hypothetical protein